tara:strand:+ start:180 stop:563 length:384 start_codon:yes stop_codon:yes gene_type:complete
MTSEIERLLDSYADALECCADEGIETERKQAARSALLAAFRHLQSAAGILETLGPDTGESNARAWEVVEGLAPRLAGPRRGSEWNHTRPIYRPMTAAAVAEDGGSLIGDTALRDAGLRLVGDGDGKA